MEKEKIVVYIDGECFTCAEDFLEWKNIVKDFENENIEILFYLHVSDFEILKPYLKKWNFSYPIIWDRYNQFFISNKLSNDRLFQVMLLDNNEKVKFVGNPLCHEGIKEFYYKYLGVNNMN